ncbi:MAG: primosomal protein N', partial [Rhodothermales bacterium]|nr:primosomal protein N' [Rhodothermales bacterium]
MIVEVALPVPVDSTFTYVVPPEWRDDVGPGYRVVVPFGTRTMTGVVIEVVEGRDPDSYAHELKPIEDVPDAYPAMTPGLLALARWISEYYVCGIGEAVRAALPPGIEIQSEIVVQRTDRPDEEVDLEGVAADVVAYLTGRGQVPLSTLRREFPSFSTARIRRLEREDVLSVESRIRGPKARSRQVKFVRLMPEFVPPEAAREAMLELRGSRQRAVMSVLLERRLAGAEEVALSEVLSVSGATAATVSSLGQKGLVEVVLREERRSPFPEEAPPPPSTGPVLHDAQAVAL